MAMTSLRRKLIAGLLLVSAILALLTAGGAFVLMSYAQLVDDLDRAVNVVPRREPMLRAAQHLRIALGALERVSAAPGNAASTRRSLEEVESAFANLENQLFDFHVKLDQLADETNVELNQLVVVLFRSIEQQQRELSKTLAELSIAQQRAAAASLARQQAEILFDSLWDLPEPTGGLTVPLNKAERVYRRGLWGLFGAIGLSFLGLLWIMWFGYRWIFRPIRVLHDGTSRIAQGDFDYRVRVDQRDEMGQLAEAFNKMTDRFQEIKQDLDRQVRERVKQLIRTERLAGIGFLATGVAHEINTPLTGILGAAQALLERKEEFLARLGDEERQDFLDYLDIMQDASKQCREITTRLLQFARGEESRGEEPVRGRVDLTQIVRDVLHMVSHMSRFREHKLVFEHRAECAIEANGTEIKQVILNLVANGLEAMPDGGTLTVALIETTDQVELRVADEGIGMTPEVLEHLFEPFFTRNKPGRGTGLGMALSHQIVSNHGGTLEPRSDGPGRGSVFILHLPRRALLSRAA